jgi:hypothetical protein
MYLTQSVQQTSAATMTISARARARVWVVAALACALTLTAPSVSAASDPTDGLEACPASSIGQSGGLGTGSTTPIDDNFATPNPTLWCAAISGGGRLQFGSGLRLSNPGTSLDSVLQGAVAHDNAEVISRPSAQTGMTMSARIRGADLRDVTGSRGWGFWNRSFTNTAGTSEMAWFLYQHSPVLGAGGLQIAPDGLIAEAQGLGEVVPATVHLNDRVLAQTHTYAITLEKHAVDFLIDGKSVARITDKASVPTGPMLSQAWVDNQFYLGLPQSHQFFALSQVQPRPTELDVLWYRQGPTASLRFGADTRVTARLAPGPIRRSWAIKLVLTNENAFTVDGLATTTAPPLNGQASTPLVIPPNGRVVTSVRLPVSAHRALARRRQLAVKLTLRVSDRAKDERVTTQRLRLALRGRSH